MNKNKNLNFNHEADFNFFLFVLLYELAEIKRNCMKKRCFICTFWEKRGIVRDYFSYYIKALAEISEKVIVVVNGEITDEGKETLLGIKNTGVLKRENFGLDFGAYKTGIEYIGYEKLKDFDELILTNCTCYGPVYPLKDMFDKMENTGCDFWGITKNNGGMWEKTEYHDHIQSYFICINNKMFSSPSFKKYWNDLILYDNYQEEVLEHETKFTEYFENLGFKSDSFIDFNFIKEMKLNPLLYAEMLLERYKLPLIKRKNFIDNYEFTKIYRFSSSLPNILTDYIAKNTDYDISMIYQDVIAVHPMSKIQDFFNLYYVLPSKFINSENSNTIKKIALILHIYYEDLIDYCLKYVKFLPGGGVKPIFISFLQSRMFWIYAEKNQN